MLGTAAAKNFASPGPRTGPASSPRRPSADSRPSSISSTASSIAGRSVTPTPNRTSQSTTASSVRPDSPAGTIPSDGERKSSRDSLGGFVPLRNGVGRQSGSAAIMRKSRAAHTRGRAGDVGVLENDSPLHASPVSHEPPPSTPLSKVPEMPKDVKKYSLTDGPVVKPSDPQPQRYSLTDAPVPVPKPALKVAPKAAVSSPSPASAPVLPPDSPVIAQADGYSSAGSAAGAPVLRPGMRKKRMYVPKNPALRVKTPQNPGLDELVGHARESSVDEHGGLRLPYMSDGLTTPQALPHNVSQLDALKTPTSADVEVQPRSPLKSPRRGKRIPSRPNSKVMSEEEGARADDEEGYEDLLSAYSEDDGGK
ncbi:hypothetical protein FRB90_008183 [Tulasnella sp. 427]|nr:hypothetical protein FRB90_008183 [Tulasnella sp. 427]